MAGLPRAAIDHLRRQHGVAHARQLRAAGTPRTTLQRLERSGQLVRVLPAVYRSGVVPDSEPARCVAMCLCRPEAVIAGPAAGRLRGLRRLPDDRRIHVIVAAGVKLPPDAPGFVASRMAGFDPVVDARRRPDGLCVVTPDASAVDLGRHVGVDRLSSIVEQLIDRHGATTDGIAETARRWAGRRAGFASAVLSLIEARPCGGAAESDGEVQLAAALRAAGVPELVRQHPCRLSSGRRVRFDLAVPAALVAIEFDGYLTHFEAAGASDDAERDREAAADGWITVRIRRTELDDLVSISDRIAHLVARRVDPSRRRD